MSKSNPDSEAQSVDSANDSSNSNIIPRPELTSEQKATTSSMKTVTKTPPPTDVASSIGGWMIVMLWVIALAGGTYFAQQWFDKRNEARNGVWSEVHGEPRALLVTSDRYGQYQVRGSANDTDVMFLLDTGATGISIPAVTAQKLQLERGKPFEVMTANGITTVYATTLDSLRIGPHARRNVRAHINPSMDGDVALLGMSFLRHYELLQRDGQLTITDPQ